MTIQDIEKALGSDWKVYPDSLWEKHGTTVAVARRGTQRYLAVTGRREKVFEGTEQAGDVKLGLCRGANAALVREMFPELSPVASGSAISFGFGDRLGIATPAHVRCIAGRNIFPVFAQQSIRENTRTKRTMQDVVDDATLGCLQAGYSASYGADADHLKDVKFLQEGIQAGYSMFTIDLSDHIKNPAEMSPDDRAAYLHGLPGAESVVRWLGQREYTIGGVHYAFSEEDARTAVITFLAGLDFAAGCYQTIQQQRRDFDFEISVDETSTTTTPLAHIFVVEYLKRSDIRFTSLAPKFPGDFEKALDYKGDLNEFTSGFGKHAQICRNFGGYRLSLHSGSDKFAVYPIMRTATDALHVKTAGTSWLQAVKAIAVTEPALYRKLHQAALENIANDRVGYVVHLDVARAPDISRMPDKQLPEVFSQPDCRQLIHITYGSLLRLFKDEIYTALFVHEDEHYKQVSEHLDKHLDLLS